MPTTVLRGGVLVLLLTQSACAIRRVPKTMHGRTARTWGCWPRGGLHCAQAHCKGSVMIPWRGYAVAEMTGVLHGVGELAAAGTCLPG